MSTISPNISEFGTVDHGIDTTSTHRHCRSRNIVKKNASALQSECFRTDHQMYDHFRESFQAGVTAAQRNMIATLLTLMLLSLLIIAYATVPAFENAFNQIASLKVKMGPLFAFVGMGLSVGFLSEFLKVRSSDTKRWTRSNVINFAFVFLMFGLVTMAKDPVYQMLALTFGDDASFSTITRKVLFEAFAWTLLLACPMQTLLFSWKAHGFSMESLRAECPTFSEFFALKIVPTLIMNWSFWLPASVIIYCFPTELQLATSIIAMSLWLCLLNALSESASFHLHAK
ncbi:hypothetical protein ACWPKS_05195 [Coraliomargarita sp. W4R72]